MNKKRSKESVEASAAGMVKAAAERKDAATSMAEISLRKDRELARRGKDKPVTQEMRDEALVMLANGYPMDRVTQHFGIDRSALLVFGYRDADFGARLKDAMAIGTVELINTTFRILDGEAGFTTGSIERDKARADNIWRYAKTIGNRIFGDKIQVETTQIMYALPAPEFDATVVEVTVEPEADPEAED